MKPNDFCWNELMTTDAEKAKTFYNSLFGWKYEAHEMAHLHDKYNVIQADKTNVGGIVQLHPEKWGKIPPNWLSFVCVDNLDAAIKKAISLGATLKIAATPAGDFGPFAIIIDPTGAHLALKQANK